jgi:hypothetical protein
MESIKKDYASFLNNDSSAASLMTYGGSQASSLFDWHISTIMEEVKSNKRSFNR